MNELNEKNAKKDANKSTYEYGDVFAESLDFNNVYRFVAHLQKYASEKKKCNVGLDREIGASTTVATTTTTTATKKDAYLHTECH